jgi:hypothetical protein
MPFFAGNCTYRYTASWTASYLTCGFSINGQISSATGDPYRCGGTATCNSTTVPFTLSYICGSYSSTPQRTKGFSGSTATYYIMHSWLTNTCNVSASGGILSWGGAAIVNNATGTSLSMNCQVFVLGSWAAAGGTVDSNMYGKSCYRYQIRCSHSYLNDTRFSAVTNNSFWTQTCQPCY